MKIPPRTCRKNALLLCLFLASNVAWSQRVSCSGFQAVTSWRGSFNVSGSGTGPRGDRGLYEYYRANQTVSGSFRLVPDLSNPGTFFGSAIKPPDSCPSCDLGSITATASIQDRAYSRSDNRLLLGYIAEGPINSLGLFANLAIDYSNCTYRFQVYPQLPVAEIPRNTPGEYAWGPRISPKGTPQVAGLPVDPLPLPKTGLTLTQSFEYIAPPLIDDSVINTTTVKWQISWTLTPDVCEITSVEWREANSPLANNPGPGGGLMIFQGHHSIHDPQPNKYVDVVVRTNKPRCEVHVALYDPDDPSSNQSPVDPNGPAGGDNRGGLVIPIGNTSRKTSSLSASTSQGLLGFWSVETDDSGVAVAPLYPSMQPGDNYRLAASTNEDYLEMVTVAGMDLRDGDGAVLPTARGKVSPPLTTWRYLFIEADSMAPPVNNNTKGSVIGIQEDPLLPLLSVVTIAPPLPAFNQYEKGRLVIDGDSFSVLATACEPAKACTLTVAGRVPLSNIGKAFTLYDDDDFNFDDRTGDGRRRTDGDEGETLPQPDLSYLQTSGAEIQNVLAPAYVMPSYTVPNPRPVAAFQKNLGEEITLPFDNRALFQRADPGLWISYILAAYQAPVCRDGDPDVEAQAISAPLPDCDTKYGIGHALEEAGQGAIFLEQIAELGQGDHPGRKRSVVAHEIIHLLGGVDEEGGIMGEPDKSPEPNSRLAPPTIARIRSLQALGGGTNLRKLTLDTSDEFGLQLRALTASKILPGEVVEFECELRNQGDSPAVPPTPVDNCSLLVSRGDRFFEIREPGRLVVDSFVARKSMAPGESGKGRRLAGRHLRLQSSESFDLNSDFAWDRPGTYHVKAALIDPVTGRTVESNVVTVEVEEPFGIDLLAWKELQADPDIASALQSTSYATSRGEDLSFRHRLERYRSLFESSRYGIGRLRKLLDLSEEKR